VLYQLGFLNIKVKQQKKAVQIFENYLSTKDKTYVVEVLYQLGFLYIEAKQQKKAVQIFKIISVPKIKLTPTKSFTS